MKRISVWFGRTLSTGRQDARLVEIACFLAVPALLVLGMMAVGRVASTPGEIYIGVMVTLLCAGQAALCGALVPYVMRNRAS